MAKIPIQDQIAAFQKVLASTTSIELEAVLDTLRFVEENRDTFADIYIARKAKAVKNVETEFPGARITDIRRV